MGVALLRAERLRRVYGGVAVVDDVSLEVRRGEILALLGANGAGKSTLFRLLLLIERADGGRILLDGREVKAGDTAAMRRLAGVFQRPFLFSGTVADNVAFGLRPRGVPAAERRARVADALELLGLERLADAPVHTLSGGEAQRVALARAVVIRPELLLLDEPTANLDVAVGRRFREDVERLARARAGAAVVITHDPADAFSLADRVAVMEAGRIVQVGTPEELLLSPATPFVAAFTGAELLLDGTVAGTESGLVAVRLDGGARVVAAASPDYGDRLATGEAVHVAYRPEDVLLVAAEEGPPTSARNRFRVRVAGLTPAGALVRVRLEGELGLVALLTRDSADTLGLAPGRELVAQLKAAALRAFPAHAAPPA